MRYRESDFHILNKVVHMKMLVKRAGYWSLFFLIGGFAHFADGKAPLKEKSSHRIVAGQYKNWHVADGLPFDRIEDVIQRKNGFLWVATQNGAARFDGIQFEIFNRSTYPGLPDNLIASLHEDAAGRLFLGHASGQVSVKTARGFVGINVPPKFDGTKVRGFSESASGAVWAEYGKRGRLLVAVKEQLVLNVSTVNPLPDDAPLPGKANGWTQRGNKIVRVSSGKDVDVWGKTPWGVRNQGVTLLETSKGDLVAGLTLGGIFILRKDGSIIRLWNGDGLISNTILTLCEDHEGTVWIGSDSGLQSFRLNRYGGKKKFIKGFDSPRAITSARGEGVWVGNAQEAVHRVTRSEIRELDRPLNHTRAVRALHEDRNGVLWANHDAGFMLEVSSAGYKEVLSKEGHRDRITTFHEDPQGRLWAGGDRGLWLKENGRWRLVASENDGVSRVRCIGGGNDEVLWLGMEGRGLCRWEKGKATLYSSRDVFSSQEVSSLLVDRESGVVWIGTFGQGLFHFQDGAFRNVPVHPRFIMRIIDDETGRLWLVTEKGVLVAPKTRLLDDGPSSEWVPLMLNGSEGISTTIDFEYGLATACRKENGEIWLLSDYQVLSFLPETIQVSRQEVPLVVKELVVNDRRMSVNGMTDIRLPPGVHRLDFHYSALSFAAPEKLRFKCRLRGVDDQWLELGNRRSANYQQLDPGEYRFELLAANRDGLWNREPISYTIFVAPFWWETWWFKFLLYSTGITLIAFLSREVAGRINRKKLILAEKRHAVEQERTRIAMDIHDGVGSELTRMSMLSNRTLLSLEKKEWERVPGRVREMGDVANTLVLALDEIIWVVNPINDNLENLVAYIARHLDAFLRETTLVFEQRIPLELPAVRISGPMRHNVFLAVKEAVNNAVKHAEASRMVFEVEANDQELKISVRDNGKGISESEDTRFRRGLKSMERRMGLVEGCIEMRSPECGGTDIEFRVPLNGEMR
jgi:signal transduction histidine kinase/ligand-binding sensor domain-containing protein